MSKTQQITVSVSGQARTGLLAKVLPVVNRALIEIGFNPDFSQSLVKTISKEKLSNIRFEVDTTRLTPDQIQCIRDSIKVALDPYARTCEFSFST